MLTLPMLTREMVRLVSYWHDMNVRKTTIPYGLYNEAPTIMRHISFATSKAAMSVYLDDFSDQYLQPVARYLANQMPRDFVAEDMEAPGGVLGAALESFRGINVRGVLAWQPMERLIREGVVVPATWIENVPKFYDYETDEQRDRDCCMVLNFAVKGRINAKPVP